MNIYNSKRMRIDRDNIEEMLLTISRNKTRSLLTAFGVFWGIFMLVFMLGGGHGMKEMLVQQLAGFASNAGFIAADQTGTAYKGFRKGRTWDLELADVENLKRVKELETVIATSSLWGKTLLPVPFGARHSFMTTRSMKTAPCRV